MFTIFLYRLLFWPIFLLALPYYMYRTRKRGGYKQDWKYRFGWFKRLPKRKFGKRRLWIQAVSVGEVKAIAKMMELLIQSNEYEIVLTTTSSTGYALAKKLYQDRILFVGLFPFDFWLFSWMAWNRIFPHVALLVENEIWPEHIWQASLRRTPVILINARISNATFRHYRWLKTLASPILSRLTYVMACDELSASRCREMGIQPYRIKVSGNIKFDNQLPVLSTEAIAQLKRDLGQWTSEDKILLGSSTWPGEEEMLIHALKICQSQDPHWKLLLVPRHAERRDQITELLKKSRLKWHRRSFGKAVAAVDVCLVDTTGELQQLTTIADIAYIGKSLGKQKGGQSPIDAACCQIPIVYGDQMTNFVDICKSLERNKCVLKVPSFEKAILAISKLANSPELRQQLSRALHHWYQQNCGASEFTISKIHSIAFASK